DAAEKTAEAARGPFSKPVADATLNDTFRFDAAFTEMRQALFPEIGRRLGMTPDQTEAYLHQKFPAGMRFLDDWRDHIFEGARKLALGQTQYMDEFHNVDATPYEALPWIVMIPGAVLLAAGAAALLADRRRASTVAQAQPSLGDAKDA